MSEQRGEATTAEWIASLANMQQKTIDELHKKLMEITERCHKAEADVIEEYKLRLAAEERVQELEQHPIWSSNE